MEKVYIENAKKHTDKVCPTFNKKIDLNISIGTHLESIFHRTSSAVQKYCFCKCVLFHVSKKRERDCVLELDQPRYDYSKF